MMADGADGALQHSSPQEEFMFGLVQIITARRSQVCV